MGNGKSGRYLALLWLSDDILDLGFISLVLGSVLLKQVWSFEHSFDNAPREMRRHLKLGYAAQAVEDVQRSCDPVQH